MQILFHKEQRAPNLCKDASNAMLPERDKSGDDYAQCGTEPGHDACGNGTQRRGRGRGHDAGQIIDYGGSSSTGWCRLKNTCEWIPSFQQIPFHRRLDSAFDRSRPGKRYTYIYQTQHHCQPMMAPLLPEDTNLAYFARYPVVILGSPGSQLSRRFSSSLSDTRTSMEWAGMSIRMRSPS